MGNLTQYERVTGLLAEVYRTEYPSTLELRKCQTRCHKIMIMGYFRYFFPMVHVVFIQKGENLLINIEILLEYKTTSSGTDTLCRIAHC